MKRKVKIDWDTVELVDTEAAARPPPPTLVWSDRRGRSMVKKILSGAAAKARARGSPYTHTQLRKHIPAGIETLIYGWRLLAAALESERAVSAGVEMAARAIYETSQSLRAP